MPARRLPAGWLVALVLVLGVAWIYAPVRAHEWVRYDDEVYVFENPRVAGGLTTAGFRWAWTSGYAGNWHPLTWLSHQLDVELFGLEPGPQHLVNVALHALNALLALQLLFALLERPWAAALGAAAFAWHPLRVESVAWIAERKDVLCATFVLAGLLLYLAWGRAPSRARWILCLTALALALCAKPMAVTFPLLVLLLDHAPLARTRTLPWPRLAREKLPFAALAALAAGLTLWAQSAAGSTSSLGSLPLAVRLLNALRSLGIYVLQSLWPHDLSVFYPHAATVAAEPLRALAPGAIGGALLLALLLTAAWRCRATRPAVTVGVLFFLASLAPVIGLVQVGTQAHADRYTYLPSLGLIAALAAALPALAPARVLVPLALSATLALAVAARAALGAWRDTRTLFEHALASAPDNYLAHAKLGELALEDGELAEARARFERALALAPAFVHAQGKLALCDLAEGELERARERLLAARAREPEDTEWLLNLGVVELERGALDAARAHFEGVLAREPENLDAHFDLGLLAQRAGDAREAEARYRAVLELAPEHVEAWSNLGQVALGRGDLAAAEEALERARDLAPDDALAHLNLGAVLLRRGAAEAAEDAFQRALALDPEVAPLREALLRRAEGQ